MANLIIALKCADDSDTEDSQSVLFLLLDDATDSRRAMRDLGQT